MSLSYGNRGGDLINIDEVNNYISSLERAHNCNIVANTVFFNDYAGGNDFRCEFFFRGGYITLIAVYIIPDSTPTPTIYPQIKALRSLESGSIITDTLVQDETTIQTFVFEGEDYKACFLKRTCSLATSGYYARLTCDAIAYEKDYQNSNLSQFIVIQEPSTDLTLPRISEGVTGVCTDFFHSGVTDFSSFSTCVLDYNDDVYLQDYYSDRYGTGKGLPFSGFFLCSNFSYNYVEDMRFLFKYYGSGTDTFSIITRNQNYTGMYGQKEKYRKKISLTATSTSFTETYKEYEIDSPSTFISALKSAVKAADSDDKIFIEVANVDGGVTTFDYIRCVKVNNQIFPYIPISTTYPLSSATLFSLRENARVPHSNELFEGNIGADLSPKIDTNFDNKLITSFINGLYYTDFVHQYDLQIYNGYTLKFGIGQY